MVLTMDYAGPWAGAIVFLMLLILEFIYYGFGAALQNLSEKDIEDAAEEYSDKKVSRIHKLMEDSNQYVNTVQLVTTAFTLFAGCWYVRYLGRLMISGLQYPLLAYGISFAIMIYILLTFGIYIPKKLGRKYSVKWVFSCVNITYGFMIFLTPFTLLYSTTGNLVLRLFGIRKTDRETDVTEDEILNIVNEGYEQGILEDSEAEMINNIIEFGDKEVNEVMVNRQNIIAFPHDITIADAMEIMLKENLSRYPVFEDNIDHIIGIVHFKDMIRIQSEMMKNPKSMDQDKKICDCKEWIREAIYVPETKKIDDLFKQMQHQKQQMAVVMDEYGQTAGIVAMEDILEEIVGNIEDEYDVAEQHIEQKGQDQYVMEGMTTLEELSAKLGIDFGEQEFTTLNGFMIAKLDHIPEEDEAFDIDVGEYNFKLLSVKDNVIKEVLVTRNVTKEQ